jgi:protein-tyrosine phosphatase
MGGPVPVIARPGLAGSPAFRDLGGAPTVDGRRVAPGRLFRADELSSLDAADRAVVEALRLSVVCDLRGAAERQRTPSLDWLDPPPRRLHLEVSSGLVASVTPWLERLRQGPDPEAAQMMMRTTYGELPRSAAPMLGALFEALDSGELPVLVHCTAGKDRTGFTVAMVLSALDVDPEYIYEDYLLGSGRDPLAVDQPSAHMLEAILGRMLEPEEAHLVHGVRREYLDAAFASITNEWGSTMAYLKRAVGIDRQRRARLRERLLA